MGKIIDMEPPIIREFRERQEQNNQDLDMYRRLGVLQTFIIQGDDDEECEGAWLRSLGLSDTDTLYAVEAGSALAEVRAKEKEKENGEQTNK